MSVLQDIISHRELLQNLVVRNLKSRYKDSLLGFLWSILVPLFMAAIYLVFLRILARGVPMEEILIGVFAWQFTAQCVSNGLGAITENSNLVKKVYFPRLILPLSSMLSNLVNFLLTLVVQFALLALILAWQGHGMAWTALAVPLLVLYHALFCFALTLFLSCTNVFFRDMQHLVGVLTTAWFFLTPAMYSMGFVQDMADRYGLPFVSQVYMLNPMAGIITGYRALILPGTPFPWHAWTLAGLALPLVFLALSYRLFQKLERSFADAF